MKWLNIEQNTDAWITARIGKVTASKFGALMTDCGGLFGETAEKYALQLALERLNHRVSVNQVKTFHMQRGHQQEPIAIKLYEAENFVSVQSGGFFDCGYYGDSPDGLVGVDGAIEVKSVTAHVHMATYKRGNYDPHYHWQMVGHIDCSNRDWCDFVSFCADFPTNSQILVYRMWRHDIEKDIAELRERRAKFNERVQLIENMIKNI
ncbi:MAG: YqaJ viral recombinase family protein [Gilliamella sp.]|nr:YqaJ viral recombinase family protein [Gilliamella sp.]